MNAERIGGLFWLLFGCAAAYGGLGLELGTMQEPGSGFLTFVAGSFVALMALIIVVQSYRADPATQTRVSDLWKGVMWWRALAITGLILLFIFSFETLGFFVCSFLLLVIIMRWLEGLEWKMCLLVPSIATVSTYVVFKTMMNISLPAGIFGF
ncbi:tripartite tricarboxylate transporter TctB family protein [Zwartia vadi]|uniref:tripartite tricarboxylate transporter TctB family protein n=1 Tax=Zwartia vadi TaxID=3058168 RepID=UPI0025B30EED|nr:tripartite tricarboxylate transporter TctB family protein [Zwartia vadi]MDN3987255.1 tripartite tricarboxylate transporter TctB family protein [Zwartia vadi]